MFHLIGRSRLSAVVLITMLTGAATTVAQTSSWSSDLAGQKKMAKLENTSVLVLLEVHADGSRAAAISDWAKAMCPDTKRVRLVYPEVPYQDVAATRTFVDLADSAGIRHLPAVVVIDDRGRPSGMVELGDSANAATLTPLVQHLFDELVKRELSFAQAEDAAGTKRAQHLDAGLEHVSATCRSSYHDVMQQIIDLDPENAVGLKAKYEPVLVEVILNQAIQEQVYPLVDQAQYAAARGVLEWLAKEHPISTEQRQLLLAFEAQLLYTEGMADKAITVLERAISLAPESDAASQLKRAREQIVAPS